MLLKAALPGFTCLLCCLCLASCCNKEKSASSSPPQKGAALGLFSEDPDWSYVDMLEEMKKSGVSHTAIVMQYYLQNSKSDIIFKHERFTVPMSTMTRTAKDAQKLGMKVVVFPILRLEDTSDGGWRGNLSPADRKAFYKNYLDLMLSFAKKAEELKAPIMSCGSELSTMEADEGEWRRIIAAIRKVYKGEILYSANWDHYKSVPFWDALDYIGVTGYFELAKPGQDPSLEELTRAWSLVREELVKFAKAKGKPLILTEVGYLSQKNTAAWPWKEGADEPLDLEIQRRCYEAVRLTWGGEPVLAGLYFWNWFGWGGPTSKEYTPRNKPAALEVAKWYLRH